MSEHTPGPWAYFPARENREYVITDNPTATSDGLGYGTNIIADVRPVSSANHHEANARLIAAAPELLEACKCAAEIMAQPDEQDLNHMRVWADGVRELLAKAIAKATT